MLVWISHFAAYRDGLAVVDAALTKITFRASLAAVGSFLIALLLGPGLIRWLQARYREPNLSASKQVEEMHRHKHATPTMGGLFIMLAVLGSAVLFCDLRNPHVQAGILLLFMYALLGVWDDRRKMRRGCGLSVRIKFALQMCGALLVAALVYRAHYEQGCELAVVIPMSGYSVDLGLWFIPFAALVIVGASNAVNLTDGLDGLAGGCFLFAVTGMGTVAYVAGHAGLADYLGMEWISASGEMAVIAGAALGAVLGFLWFNCHPAQVFMGDTGSLPLGGLLGLLAIVSRQEFLLLVIGGVFVVETLSVILQVVYFKWRQRRIFRCAPLHHHFQLSGWSESKIVVRFWIVSALCAIFGLACLKVNDNRRVDGSLPATVASEAAGR
ncbi:MAG: phospho-N-acetylmuramoyl-pentapeptide-transferase [Pirellulales bacterium]